MKFRKVNFEHIVVNKRYKVNDGLAQKIAMLLNLDHSDFAMTLYDAFFTVLIFYQIASV